MHTSEFPSSAGDAVRHEGAPFRSGRAQCAHGDAACVDVLSSAASACDSSDRARASRVHERAILQSAAKWLRSATGESVAASAPM